MVPPTGFGRHAYNERTDFALTHRVLEAFENEGVRQTLQPRFPAGVLKYSSYEEMRAQEDQWMEEGIERYRARISSHR